MIKKRKARRKNVRNWRPGNWVQYILFIFKCIDIFWRSMKLVVAFFCVMRQRVNEAKS